MHSRMDWRLLVCGLLVVGCTPRDRGCQLAAESRHRSASEFRTAAVAEIPPQSPSALAISASGGLDSQPICERCGFNDELECPRFGLRFVVWDTTTGREPPILPTGARVWVRWGDRAWTDSVAANPANPGDRDPAARSGRAAAFSLVRAPAWLPPDATGVELTVRVRLPGSAGPAVHRLQVRIAHES